MPAKTQTQLYSHAAEPKTPREEEAEQLEAYAANIMFDRRVVRGNTYASRVLPAEPALLGSGGKGAHGSGSRGRPGALQQAARTPATPEPVPGRRHMDIQTDVYLEELADVAPEADCTTQTDAFLERPPTPAFVPQKDGVDCATQIEQSDLFDFDLEVEPILEVLVGKVLEQGLMEVLQEEELAAMKRHQAHFESVRAAELVAAQRLEAAERRKMEERERRLRQERERKERERVVRAKVAASAFARGYLNGIVTSVFQTLQDTGAAGFGLGLRFFVDPVEREVEELFIPWLQQAAAQHLKRSRAAHAVVQQLVADAVVLRAELKAAAMAAADAEAAAAAAAAAQQAAAAAQQAASELASIRSRAAFILRELQPPPVDEEQAEQARAELRSQAQGDVDAAWESERARVGEARRAELEAEEAATAASHQPEDSDEEAEGGADTGGERVEAEVAAAMDAVAKPEPREVTDGDVLSALIEKGAITREALVQALAVAALEAEVASGDGGGGEVEGEGGGEGGGEGEREAA
ncbi:MAG: radial spoke protein 3-domain-containing protein [Monoraphidium minutum]|nr:MAG: radial spoke protein 3-domain-containing protein [Monoraphidium minutum]